MGGAEVLLQRAREAKRRAPVVMMSAAEVERIAEEMKELRAELEFALNQLRMIEHEQDYDQIDRLCRKHGVGITAKIYQRRSR